ncbi:C40 family peptidase [Romboutsia sp.]|uniref:C40 family peptidase n=1 Tax=Romboutsia sp. TaxID=1965302 RepID=UPI003F3620F6
MLNKKTTAAVCLSTLGIVVSPMISFANAKEGVVTTGTLNVRSGPSTSYSVVTKVYKGDKIEILETSNGWHKIKLSNGKTGWSSGEYISTSSTGGSTTPSTGKTGTVTTGTLNVRSGASTSYSVVTKVYSGDKVEILESSNGWYKIKLSNGKTGWSSAQYISTSSTGGSTNPGTPSTGKTGTVTTGTLNVRSGASTSYSVVTKVYSGDKVEILESSNGWYKIKLSNGKIGWASSQYISTSSTGGSTEESKPSQDKVQKVVDLAHDQIGKPYVWGAEGPNSFDCSGLTYYVYKQVGVTLPRVSRDQYSAGKSVSKSDLQPGDLIFASTDGSGKISHVGIYVGNGYMIHSPKPGDVVQKSNMNNSYWNNAYVGARRVL